MRLERIAFTGFRNLQDAVLEPAPATTVLLGDNGQGKTSLLEAIAVLASTRSFRKARSAEILKHGSPGFSVRGTVRDERGPTELVLSVEGGKRRTSVGRVDVELSEYVGHLVVVAITQAHAGIVRGSPADRRDYLDRGLIGCVPSYLRSLAAHRRSLKQKNALLRSGHAETRPSELAVWNEQLAQDAAEIVLRRREYIRGLREILRELGPQFLPPSETLEIRASDVLSRAESAPSGAEDEPLPSRSEVAEALLKRMDELVAREIGSCQALVGPHRDDMVISLSGRDLRRYASSGQQRHALLALKMAKVELFGRFRGEPPLLLVDDVDTEIDPSRLGIFLAQVGRTAQTFITSSKRDLFRDTPPDSAFHFVKEGCLNPL